jgi:hypothetical protein
MRECAADFANEVEATVTASQRKDPSISNGKAARPLITLLIGWAGQHPERPPWRAAVRGGQTKARSDDADVPVGASPTRRIRSSRKQSEQSWR